METYKGYEIKIMIDSDPMNPRTDWDPYGTMVCFHNKYNLGDEHDFGSPEDLLSFLKEKKDNIVALPLYLLDHSGITMRTSSFNDPWDSGMVGYIYKELTPETIGEFSQEWIDKYHNGKSVAEVVQCILEGEVKTYTQFLEGDVYGYEVQFEDDSDSCCGFFGSDHEKSGLLDAARSIIDSHVHHKAIQDHKKRLEAIKSARGARAFSKRKKAVRAL